MKIFKICCYVCGYSDSVLDNSEPRHCPRCGRRTLNAFPVRVSELHGVATLSELCKRCDEGAYETNCTTCPVPEYWKELAKNLEGWDRAGFNRSNGESS